MHEPEVTTTTLSALFGDHAVFQQDRPLCIWGWDRPGQKLGISLRPAGGAHALCQVAVTAGADGRFRALLPALTAGGPYELEVEGSGNVTSRDVWVGEVWLASGQSNMEWRLASARDADQEIAAARSPAIRMFKVVPRAAQTPARDVCGSWVVCSPETAADFSAVGYFFARALHEARAVSVGIIDATWGGTCIEAWASFEALAPVLPELPELRAQLASQLSRLPELEREYAGVLGDWQRKNLPRDEVNQGEQRGWASPSHDDASWQNMSVPGYWQAQGLNVNGVVWFRKTVDLPPELAGHDLELCLGAVDDFDDTYFDGSAVGKTGPGTVNAHQVRRRYRVPASNATRGRHLIAVRVFDHFGNGGFAGPKGELYLARADGQGPRLPLAGEWRYQIERAIPLVSHSVFQTLPAPPLALALQNAPASLFHGMIAPLAGYGLRGVIWYQGESNTTRHRSYRALQVALMRDWRTRFGQGIIPFYYVQLANYRSSSDWPLLREAQAQALSEPETGMAVSIDIGEPDDIHPKNKQEVGRRLSLLARARTYGEAGLLAEGPRLSGVAIEGREVRVRFDHAQGLRTADGGAPRGFFLAGSDARFVPARARIAGEDVWLEADEVPEPRAVRYAFADNPDANLVNEGGLPAMPFRTDGY